MGTIEIRPASATERGVRALVDQHVGFARSHTAPELVFAPMEAELGGPAMSLFAARLSGRVVAIGALRALDPWHGELKSMHTDAPSRSRGVGRELLRHLITVAGWRGYRRLSLETGTGFAFAPARALYASEGFAACGQFGEYPAELRCCFMTLVLPRLAAR